MITNQIQEGAKPNDNSHVVFATVTMWTNWLGFFGALALVGAFIISGWTNPSWNTVVRDHFQAVVGLPAAALGAFMVVSLFRTTEGRIAFQMPAFKFEGASGPIVMWAMCFLAIVAGIKIVW